MSDPNADAATALALKRRNAQALLAQGYIGRDTYDAIGRHEGWLPPPPRSPGAKALTVASVLGYLGLIAAAAAEIASKSHPELKGPLEQLGALMQLIVGGL